MIVNAVTENIPSVSLTEAVHAEVYICLPGIYCIEG